MVIGAARLNPSYCHAYLTPETRTLSPRDSNHSEPFMSSLVAEYFFDPVNDLGRLINDLFR